MGGIPFLRQISPELTKPCRFKGSRPLVIGLLTGLMPCGALASMWLFAAASGSAAKGAESMFTFGLGTCVFMLAFGAFGALVPAKYNKYIPQGQHCSHRKPRAYPLSMGIRMI